MDEYIGIVKLFAGGYAPDGWLMCDGRLLPIQQYAALFSIIGTYYGGDGHSTFALPDLRSRVPVGAGGAYGYTPRSLGEKFGNESVVMNMSNMPMSMVNLDAKTSDVGVTHGVVGHNPVAVNVVQPSLAMNYIICYAGVYPPRP